MHRSVNLYERISQFHHISNCSKHLKIQPCIYKKTIVIYKVVCIKIRFHLFFASKKGNFRDYLLSFLVISFMALLMFFMWILSLPS